MNEFCILAVLWAAVGRPKCCLIVKFIVLCFILLYVYIFLNELGGVKPSLTFTLHSTLLWVRKVVKFIIQSSAVIERSLKYHWINGNSVKFVLAPCWIKWQGNSLIQWMVWWTSQNNINSHIHPLVIYCTQSQSEYEVSLESVGEFKITSQIYSVLFDSMQSFKWNRGE